MARRSIEGCRVLLTGASSGIGQALATQMVQRGARLVVMARRIERLQGLAESLANAPGQLVVFPGDVTLPETRQAAFQHVGQSLGGLDLLINNAGIGAMGRFENASPDRLRQVMEVNLFAPAEMIRQAVPLLKAGKRPMIVNVGSILGHRGIPLRAEYCASKAALHSLSESLRAELASVGIDVLVVSPGTTQTEFFDNALDPAQAPRARVRAMTSEVVARRTIGAICRGKHEIVIGTPGKALVWINRLFPRILDAVLARYR